MKRTPHKMIAFRVSEDAAEALRKHAERTGKSQTHLIERAILRYCTPKPDAQ